MIRNSKDFSNCISAIFRYATIHIFPSLPGSRDALQQLFTTLEILYRRSPRTLIDETKRLGAWYLGHLTGRKSSAADFTYASWDFESDCPAALSPVLRVSPHKGPEDKEPNMMVYRLFQRVVRSFLDVGRVVIATTSPDYTSITDPGDPVPAISSVLPDTQDILSELGITRESFTREFSVNNKRFEPYLATSMGPNGVATLSAHVDARVLTEDPTLDKALRHLVHSHPALELQRMREGCAKLPYHMSASTRLPWHSRVVPILERGGKLRNVAQVDIWTQYAMTPMHETVAHFLKKLPQDGTFDQSKVIDWVRRQTELGMECVSLDLKNATDRLPYQVYHHINTFTCKSSKFRLSWLKVLLLRAFSTPEGDSVVYQRGVPMGIKSTFPMLALAHHVIIRQAARNAGMTNFSDYVVLGDDSCIASPKVVEEYRKILGSLGVPINETKSVVSGRPEIHVGEIARRTFIDGHDMSPLPVRLTVRTIRQGERAPELQEEMSQRGFILTNGQWWDYILGLVAAPFVRDLAYMNGSPHSVTGFSVRYPFSATERAQCRNWLENTPLSNSDVENYYLYVEISRALQRADAIIRTATNTAAVIFTAAKLSSSEAFYALKETTLSLNELQERADEYVGLSDCHPMVTATQAEIRRLTTVLAQIGESREGSIGIVKSGFVDRLRSPLVEVLNDDEPVRRVVDRSVFLSTLALLQKMDQPKAEDRTTSFTIRVGSMEKVWQLKVSVGKPLFVNSLKARVDAHAQDTATAKADVMKLFPGVPVSHPVTDDSNTSGTNIIGSLRH